MANFFAFEGFVPVVDPSSFVHPNATVTGNVVIGKSCYIGPGCALRGDWGGIEIGDGCNVQENCTVHMFPGVTVVIEDGAHVGHGAVIHGAHLGKNVLIGMNAVIMDEAEIGEGSIVGALTFIAAGTKIPPRKVVVGNPGRVVKDVSDEMLAWKTAGTELYQALPNVMRDRWTPCQPLAALPADRPAQPRVLETWKRTIAKLGADRPGPSD